MGLDFIDDICYCRMQFVDTSFITGMDHRRSSEKLALNLRINTDNNTTTTTTTPPPKIAKKARLKLFKTRLKYKYKKNTFFIMQKIDTRYPMDK